MRFQCPACELIIEVDDDEIGKEVECRACHDVGDGVVSLVTVPDGPLAEGAALGDFAIVSKINEGITEDTYCAYQVGMARPVLLKVLKDEYAASDDTVIAFVKEIRELGLQGDPQPCEPLVVGNEDGIYYQAYKVNRNDDELSRVITREVSV